MPTAANHFHHPSSFLFDLSATSDPEYQRPGHPEAPLTSTDSDSWQPPAVVQGDIARAMFYMAVRYTGDVASEPALFLTDNTGQVTSTTNLIARLSTLLQWHLGDPVNAAESNRNDRVFALYQHNRNPFVDRPEWVLAAFLPQLRVSRATNGVQLAWPAEYNAARIESAAGFPAVWMPVTNAPTLRGNQWTLDVLFRPQPRFFRLNLH